tara:strand:+ start:978 stop:1448 length:471 start_codon:yes stop_codon:yes gene_type:complete
MAIKQYLLSLASGRGVTLKTSIDDRIVAIISIQHLGLSTMLLEQSSKEGSSPSAILSVICSGRDRLERHEFLKRFNQLILRHISFAGASGITACNIPDRDRVVIRTCDVKLLSVESRECRCQNPSLVGLPSVDTVIFLAERGGGLVFAVLNSAVFL